MTFQHLVLVHQPRSKVGSSRSEDLEAAAAVWPAVPMGGRSVAFKPLVVDKLGMEREAESAVTPGEAGRERSWLLAGVAAARLSA
mmetsp:Transcript_26023/g.82233  ORF Transcript_26023/g.82233 Transcript_26023/m.82233 type:complete len:85 (-) Transcript_26023:692-946(-)